MITSDPVAICHCRDGEPRCDLRSMSTEAYPGPGQPFTVPAVGVGQRYGVMPTIVRSYHQNCFLASFWKIHPLRNFHHIAHLSITSFLHKTDLR